jgi:hypothetical protein
MGIHVCTGPKSRHDVAERVAQEYSWRRKAQICVSQLFGQPIITQRFHCSVSQIVWYYKNGNPRLSLPGNSNRTERRFEEQKIKNDPFPAILIKINVIVVFVQGFERGINGWTAVVSFEEDNKTW